MSAAPHRWPALGVLCLSLLVIVVVCVVLYRGFKRNGWL